MRMVAASLVAAGFLVSMTPAAAHDCRVVGNDFLKGGYEGDCDERTERAHGHGTARGQDTYVGSFAKGRLEGDGAYTWQDGATLIGTFKAGKAHGAGMYTTAQGVRYQGNFVDGRLDGLKRTDCPSTSGPINC
jgi:hypothetical protein